MVNKVYEHQVVNLTKYTLDRFIRYKKVHGIVKYQVKLKELKNPVYLTEKHFESDKDYKRLIQYKCHVSGDKYDGSETHHEVEKIISHRKDETTGRRVYLVQWKGFTHPVWRSEYTAAELSNCKEILKEYQEDHNKERRGVRKARKDSDEDDQ